MFELTDRDYADFFFEFVDLEAQLLAIRAALARHKQADAGLAEQIAELAARAERSQAAHNEYVTDLWTEKLHASVFQDAAHSAAAVGMLAPLLESVFVTVFRGFEKMGVDKLGEAQTSERSVRASGQFWNAKLHFGSGGVREDLPLGIIQLAGASGLQESLPSDFGAVVKALFLYRNRMLHSGFEWPAEDRLKFAKSVAEQRFPESWFRSSERNGEPWIFYMSDELIDRVLRLVDDVLVAAGSKLRSIDMMETGITE